MRCAVLVVGGRDRAHVVMVCGTTVLIVAVIIVTYSKSSTLRNCFTMHLVFFLFAHAMYLFFEELHLIGIAVPDFVFLPLFVFPAFLNSFFVQVEATEVLQLLQFVV